MVADFMQLKSICRPGTIYHWFLVTLFILFFIFFLVSHRPNVSSGMQYFPNVGLLLFLYFHHRFTSTAQYPWFSQIFYIDYVESSKKSPEEAPLRMAVSVGRPLFLP